MNSIQYKNCFGHLIGTSSKRHKFWGQNFKRNLPKRLKNWILQFFQLSIFGSTNLGSLHFTGWDSSTYDIRKNKIWYFKAVSKSVMAAQNPKKIFGRNFLCFWMSSSKISWFFKTKCKSITKLKNRRL